MSHIKPTREIMTRCKPLKLDYNGQEMGEGNFTEEDYIVLSLHPEPYERILSGEKTYEYRTRFRKRPTIAFIYVTSPVKCISGIIRFGTPLIASPEEIGRIAEQQKPGNGKSVTEYLSKYNQGYAIPIHKVIKITPVPLASLQSEFGFTPPQAYLYLKNNRPLFDFLVIQSGPEVMSVEGTSASLPPH